MTSATILRSWLTACLFVLGVALGTTGCSNGGGHDQDTGTPDVVTDDGTDPDVPPKDTEDVDGIDPFEVGVEVDTVHLDTIPECPDTKCQIGKVSCPTDQYELICVAFDEDNCPDVGVWGDAVECPADAGCVQNEGCVCDMGACTEGDTSGCIAPQELATCQEWACVDDCCAIAQIDDCCNIAVDCVDDDPCTQDLCDMQGHVCIHTNKAETGLCDDGDPCTEEGCDPLSGACTNTLNPNLPDCAGNLCYGNTQAVATQTHCDVIDPCIVPTCDFENGFQPWGDAQPPDCGATPEVCGTCITTVLTNCDDEDPCTDDYCVPGQGCAHDLKLGDPGCFCIDTADCLPLIDGPCQQVKCLVSQHVCAKSPKDCEDGHPCTLDFCDQPTNLCVHQLIEPTPPECEDLELCYDDDYCDQKVQEDYGENCACKVSDCQFVQGKNYGLCIFEDVGCDDNNPCTLDICGSDGETCACAYDSIDCDDGDPCTEDSCDAILGCYHGPLNVSDGNPCTIDTCDPDAVLLGYKIHTPLICDEKLCQDGTCNSATGLCNYVWDSCDDGNPCTIDECNGANGDCLHAPTICNDSNPCTIDYCDPVDGVPEFKYCVKEDVACNDGNLCTEDVCNQVTGTCMHPPVYCNDQNACTLDSCTPGIGCISNEPLDCTDCIHPNGTEVLCPGGNGPPGFEINNCTLDLCDPVSGCSNVPVVNVAAGCGGCIDDNGDLDHVACDDGNLCTLDQCACLSWNPANPTECTLAECQSAPKECDCPGACAVCTCDPYTGVCGAVPGNCADCVNPDTGETVLCPTVVPAGFVKNLCTLDACDMDSGECMHNEVECFDNNLCTEDVCNPIAGCTYPALSCDDAQPCTVDTCQPGAGCLYVEECNDNDLCTVDACMGVEPFECQFLAVDCDDDNPCTVDICDGGGVCIYQAVGCNDGDPCTIDACDPQNGDPEDGYCLHAPKLCTDGNPCTVDICHPMNGSCYFQEISCDDCINPGSGAQEECPGMAPEGFVKNLCTEDFAVQGGGACQCNHTTVNPADQDLCTADSCDPVVGVINEPTVCVDDGDPCTIETCNPVSGLCSATLVTCVDDGDPCTENVPEATDDPDLGLICVCAVKPLDCDDGDACTTDATFTQAGVCLCVHEDVVCEDDDDPCTTDICKFDAGCVHVPPECEDGDVCTYDWCNPSLAELSDDPDVYCVHEEKSCQDCIHPVTLHVIQNCIELPEGYIYNECTQGDYCDLNLGGCQYPQVTECPADQDLCTLEYCDPTTGQCASDPLDCDDGNLCTVDQCVGGQCVKTTAPGAACTGPADCDDDDPCTQDLCATTGDCSCSNPPVDCDDDDCCTVDICDPDPGECTHTPVFPGCSTCAEDLDCLVECPVNPFTGLQVEPDDVESGLCDPNTEIIIDDENTIVVFRDACNHWLCDLDGGQGCGEGVGQCVNNAVVCDDDDPCTLDFCDAETGCFYEPNPACCTPLTDPPLMEDDPAWDPQISVCFDGDPCTVESCDYESGACGYGDLECSDGNVCTADTCGAGEGCAFSWQMGCEYVCYNDFDCSAGAGNLADGLGLCSTDLCTFTVDPLGNCVYDGIVCGGGKPCTEGVCDPEGGCSYKPLGAACAAACETDADCDDGWACSNAVCDDGTCLVSVTPCSDEDPCTRDFCDPSSGLCGVAALGDCDADGCVAGGGDAWCNDGNACTIDWCDAALDQCMYALKSCDDGDLCTTDVCDPVEGCLFFPMVPCLACFGAGDCDDGNPCTEDICKNANPAAAADEDYMNDGKAHPVRYCSHKSICAECEGQVDCDAYVFEHPCVEGATCDTVAGMCDIDFTVCDDGDPCTADECNPFTGDCQHSTLPDCCKTDEACGPVLPCYAPYCDPASHICLSLPSLCDDFDPCTADSCNVALGCVHGPIGACTTECEKPQDCYSMGFGPVSCTIAVCDIDGGTGAGTCEGTPLLCDDGNPCTTDACVPLLGCQYYLEDPQCTFGCAIDLDCDDGDPCTDEECDAQAKTCAYSRVTCDDQDPCTADWCNPATGACTHEDCGDCQCDEGCVQNSACNDGNTCTLDLCNSGVCSHLTLPCWDGDPCTDDTCDPSGGCMFLPLPLCAGCTSEMSCDDGNICTQNACVDQYCISQDLCGP
ncbi:MAG: hypothetical protein ABIK09_03860 [Pseudomonadota bacterium]